MALSPRMNFPYPDDGVDPWYDQFQAMVEAIDATAYAMREDDGVLVLILISLGTCTRR